MIKEQTPYFAHDFNATMDPKIQDMLFELGPSGFAYWAVIETLWQQQGRFPLAKIRSIALIAHAKPSLIEKIIKCYGLFEYDDKDFWSPSQLARQEQRNNLIKSRQEAGRKGGKSRRNPLNASQLGEEEKQDESKNEAKLEAKLEQSLSNKLNKIKEKETKLNENNDIPDANASSPQVESADVSQQDKGKIKSTNQVMELWNRMIDETGAPLRKVARFTDKRKKKVQVRWREFMELGDPTEVVLKIFTNACTSKFFQGDNPRGWSGDFDWLFENDKNWVKTYEGKYDEHKPSGAEGGYDRLHIPTRKPEDFEGDF